MARIRLATTPRAGVFADLDRFSWSSTDPHRPAWWRFNKKVGTSGDVGIWHETFKVRGGDYEGIYNNMPRVGLAAAGEYVTIGSKTDSAAQRIGETVAPAPAETE